MNKRIVIIDNCNDCPYFSNYYFSYEEKCRKLDRVISRKPSSEGSLFSKMYPIPEDCPLEKPND